VEPHRAARFGQLHFLQYPKKKIQRLDKQAQKNIEMLRLSTATIITLCSRNIFLHFLFCVFCKWVGCMNMLEL
jgi:hypothetical protein